MVYRGAHYASLRGIYFYGDFCTGRIWGSRVYNRTRQRQQLLDSPLRISSFGEDEDGRIYVASLGGAIYVLSPTHSPTHIDLVGSWAEIRQDCKTTPAGTRCTLLNTFRLRNRGTRRAPAPARVKFHLSNDAVLDESDVELKQLLIRRINAGELIMAPWSKQLPLGANASGKVLIAVVDTENAIAETSENNNIIASKPIP